MVLKSDNIGIYLRLSEEDYDVGSSANGSLKEESNSISNQRRLIIDYLKRRKEFAGCTFHEYCEMKIAKMIQFENMNPTKKARNKGF